MPKHPSTSRKAGRRRQPSPLPSPAASLAQLARLIHSRFPPWAVTPNEQQLAALYKAEYGRGLQPRAYGFATTRQLLAECLREIADGPLPRLARLPLGEEPSPGDASDAGKQAQAEETLLWRAPPLARLSSSGLLHEQMLSLAHAAQPDEGELALRRSVLNRLQEAARTIRGAHSPLLELFGSSATNLSLPASDLDVSGARSE